MVNDNNIELIVNWKGLEMTVPTSPLLIDCMAILIIIIAICLLIRAIAPNGFYNSNAEKKKRK